MGGHKKWGSLWVVPSAHSGHEQAASTSPPVMSPSQAGAWSDGLAEQFGLALPEEMRALYRCHDGGFARVLPEGAWFRSVNEIASEWPTFAQLADDNFAVLPAELVVQGTHWDAPYPRGWVPFGTREDFDIWIDLVPGPMGASGQVLYPVGEASVIVVAKDVLTFLERWAAILESGSLEWREGYDCPLPRNGTAMLDVLRANQPSERIGMGRTTLSKYAEQVCCPTWTFRNIVSS